MFKRLAERMQAGAMSTIADAGMPLQSGHMAVQEAPSALGRAELCSPSVLALGLIEPR